MPDIKGNNQQIFDYLSSKGASGIGNNADEFQKFMEKDENRRQVYDYLSSVKAQGIGDSYEAFSSMVYASPDAVKEQTPSTAQTAVADAGKNATPVQQSVPKPSLAEQNAKWAVQQADWNAQAEKPFFGPGEPVSVPEKK